MFEHMDSEMSVTGPSQHAPESQWQIQGREQNLHSNQMHTTYMPTDTYA